MIDGIGKGTKVQAISFGNFHDFVRYCHAYIFLPVIFYAKGMLEKLRRGKRRTAILRANRAKSIFEISIVTCVSLQLELLPKAI